MADAKQPALTDALVLFGPSKATLDPEAWKNIIGSKPVCARLDTLPEAKPRWSALFASTIFQIALTAVVAVLPTLFPGRLVDRNAYQAVYITPQTEIRLPEAQPISDARVVTAPPPTVKLAQRQPVAKLTAPRAPIPTQPELPQAKTIDVPRLSETSTELNLGAPSSEPARPRDPVKVGTLVVVDEPPAMSDKPREQVQTGGFGDPNGLPADDSNKRGNVPRSGSPALLPGPGYGNGAGGVTGRRSAVASAGFGSHAETSAESKGSRRGLEQGGFESAAVGSAVPRAKQAGPPSDVQPVVILSKPDPSYSDEARRLGLEGEVLVEVVFLASGEVQVLRVRNGLGHGLDEAAVRAAQQIRFKPALQEGKPIDFLATVRIEFELAF